jgi:hypothetical protein
MKDFDPRLNAAWWTLGIGLGAGPIIAGIDKFFNILTNWEMYLSPIRNESCARARPRNRPRRLRLVSTYCCSRTRPPSPIP